MIQVMSSEFRVRRIRIRYSSPRTSKYPPSKLGDLRLLAPQRGLTAIGKGSNPPLSPFVKRGKSYPSLWKREGGGIFKEKCIFPKMSNTASPPAKPGVYLKANYSELARAKHG
jgi:hypothetical protein